MALWTSRRSLLAGAGGLTAAASLGACANNPIVGFDRANRSLDICNSGEPLSLDPHKASGAWENNIVGDMFVGLVTENAKSEPIPGMAERWDVSEDGRTWTFYLRRARWSDGEACNAHDFAFAFRRTLDPATVAEGAAVLYPIRNAEAVNKGQKAVSELGVRAIDDLTLEIHLQYPTPYFLQILKHYASFPVPKHIVRLRGDNWVHPDHIVVNGPFKLVRWLSNYIVHLERNLFFYDAPNVDLQNLYFYPSSDANAAAERVKSGEAGWSTRFASNQVEQLRAALPGYPRVASSLACSYFCFNTRRAPFNDARVRRAFAMAYDRDWVAANVYKTGERAAYSFVPPGVAGYPNAARYAWAGQPFEARHAEAERLLREAGYGPNNPLSFEFSHASSSESAAVAAAAQQHWGQIAPWVSVRLHGAEARTHEANLRTGNFECGEAAWIADYNDAKMFLFQHETRAGSRNYSGYSNREYDQLMHISDFETDPVARAAIMNRAEGLMLGEAPVCMSVFVNSTNLVHPDLMGYEDNLENIHRARWFRMRIA